MTLISTQEREEAKRHFVGQLKFGPTAWKEAFAEACIDGFREMEVPHPRQRADGLELGFLFQRLRWVIRDDDLQLADSLMKATVAAASANFFVGEATTTAVAGVVSGLFSMCRAMKKKGAKLSDEQCALLVVLTSSGRPLDPSEIEDRLNDPLLSPNKSWSADRVHSILTSLQKIRLGDGTVTSLVACDADDRWACAGI